jgi:MoxR-like ATPase
MAIAKEIGLECYRVNMSYATDVDDMLGGLRLKNDATVFEDGPVIRAMRMGAILLLDEIDTAQANILMELHPIAEGKGVLIKKTGEYVQPHPNFRIIATGNSKGRGDLTGKYTGVRPLNHAFLDRFAIYYDFITPTSAEMIKIIEGQSRITKTKTDIIKQLASFYTHIQDCLEKEAISDGISIRRIVDIANVVELMGIEKVHEKRMKLALKHTFAFYDQEMQEALTQMWDNILPEINTTFTDLAEEKVIDKDGEEIPF